MSITENFLVNTKNFESIIQQLRSVNKLPAQLNIAFLERLGYSNPSDLLVLHLFKDLEMLEQDGTPTPLFEKFRSDATTNVAMAEGITNAYTELFKSNIDVYKLQQDDLIEEFKKFFGSNKSDLILKYMANTFLTLVNYAGLKTMNEVANERFEDEPNGGSSLNNVTEHQNNGSSKPPSAGSDSEEEIAVVDADDNIKKEEKGKAAIEDFFPKKKEEKTEEKQKGSDSKNRSELRSESDNESKSESGSNPDIGSKSDLELNIEKELQSGSTEDLDSPDSEAESDDDSELKRRIESTKKEIEEKQKEKQKAQQEEQDNDEPGMNGSIVEHINKGGDDSASKPDSSDAVEEVDPFGFEEDDSDDELEDLDLDEELNLEEVEPQAKGNKEYLDKAFVKKAELLYRLEKYEEALPAYKTIVDRYADSDDPFLREHVSKAVIRRASILGKLQRYDEALPAYDDVIDRFENSEKPEFYNYASEALIKKVEIIEMLELEEQLMPLYTKLVKRLGDSDDPRFATHVDKAFVKVAKMKLDSGEPEKALRAINGAIKRFSTSERENEFLEQAMYQKAELLEQLGRDEEALEAYENFLSKFGSDS